jgi:hypothetical protein
MHHTKNNKEKTNTKKRNLLIKWLQKPCIYSNNVFKDPGYSDYYKGYFNLTNGAGINPFYKVGDIDHILNVGYVDYTYNDSTNKLEDDVELEQFIDYLPIHVPIDVKESIRKNYKCDEAKYKIETLSRENMLILPGSNHCNSNYLYKKLRQFIENNNFTYDIPLVNANPVLEYKCESKMEPLYLDKEDFYEFLHNNSK